MAYLCAVVNCYFTALCIYWVLIMAKRKNPAAVALGKLGGTNSRKNLSKTKRRELAQRAAEARWGKKKGPKKEDRDGSSIAMSHD
jgi:hypothetical protein